MRMSIQNQGWLLVAALFVMAVYGGAIFIFGLWPVVKFCMWLVTGMILVLLAASPVCDWFAKQNRDLNSSRET